MSRSAVFALCVPLMGAAGCIGGPETEVQSGAVEEVTAERDNCWAGPNDFVRTIRVGNVDRTFWVHVPRSYDCTNPAPLVLNFHGGFAIGLAQEVLSLMNAKADREGFIVAYPDGMALSWNAGYCCAPAMFLVDDVAFARAVVDDIETEFLVDDARVYATGMSNGALMAHKLACEAPDLFAGFAPVAGANVSLRCSPSRRAPMIAFHGTADPLVTYTGNLLFPGGFVRTMEGWARRNGCATTRQVVFQNGDSTCEAFDGCPADGAVEMCTVQGGGHTWPGGFPVPPLGKTTYDLSANDAMWDFWRAHPR